MRLERPTLLRALTMVVSAAAIVLAPATPVLAHNGTGGASSDYRIEITGYRGDPTGVRLRVIELGNRVELQRTSADDVLVLGYEGEPYLHFDAGGVFENVNSPAHYLNRDRFAATNPPSTASADAQPSWSQVASGTVFRWHDHRAHWMSPIPATEVQAAPDVERVVHTDTLTMQIDGRVVDATIRVTWLPKPDRTIWLAAAALLAAIVAATFVLVRGADRYLPGTVVVASVAVLFASGGSGVRVVISAVAITAAIVGMVTRQRLVSVGAAVTVSLLAATRLEVFEHELLAGWVSGRMQRVAIVIAFGLGIGALAASIVAALSPSPAQPTALTSAEVTVHGAP